MFRSDGLLQTALVTQRKRLPGLSARAQDEGMTGDPDEREDILGFGNTDRASRADHLGRFRLSRSWVDRLSLRLDRLTLRLTRRPRLAATVATLAAVALASGAGVFLTTAHSVTPSSTARLSLPGPQPLSTPPPPPPFTVSPAPGSTAPGSTAPGSTTGIMCEGPVEPASVMTGIIKRVAQIEQRAAAKGNSAGVRVMITVPHTSDALTCS
jgi:hypothetical protein